MFARSLLLGSNLSSFSMSSRLGIARIAAMNVYQSHIDASGTGFYTLSRAFAAAPVALENTDEASDAMLETACGAGAGDALTAAMNERAATSTPAEDSMAGEWTWQSAETAETCLAFYREREGARRWILCSSRITAVIESRDVTRCAKTLLNYSSSSQVVSCRSERHCTVSFRLMLSRGHTTSFTSCHSTVVDTLCLSVFHGIFLEWHARPSHGETMRASLSTRTRRDRTSYDDIRR